MNLHDQDTFLRGKNEGIQLGRSEGIQLGISRGIAQGSQQAKIETAISMLKDNVSIETIIKYTELSRNTVEGLIAKK